MLSMIEVFEPIKAVVQTVTHVHYEMNSILRKFLAGYWLFFALKIPPR
jgi:hypothetical protein